MNRFFWIMLIAAVTGLAQDTARMDAVAKEQAAGDKFMGNALVAKDGAVLFERS